MNPDTFRIILMLARVCVSEGGWEGHQECVVIVNALMEQAEDRGITLERQICAYAPNSCDRRRQDDRRWIAYMTPDGRAPRGWPRLNWERYRVRLAAMMVVAYRAYLGIEVSSCPAGYHWGSSWCSSCRRRMRQSGFRRIDCPIANNFWYARPRR